MTFRSSNRLRAVLCYSILAEFNLLICQTSINLGTQGRNVDFTSAPYTRPVKSGTSLPATCSPGDLFFSFSAQPGQNLYGCPAPNTWSMLGQGTASTGGVGVTSGALAALPVLCNAGALYFATDQPAGQQLYTCSSTNVWTQVLSLGPSGALVITNGSLDIATAVVPRLMAANTFTGLNAFGNGVQLTTTTATAQPACNSSTRGLFWFQNNGGSKDGVQVCVFTGVVYGWISLY